jgi:hypothetical protein
MTQRSRPSSTGGNPPNTTTCPWRTASGLVRRTSTRDPAGYVGNILSPSTVTAMYRRRTHQKPTAKRTGIPRPRHHRLVPVPGRLQREQVGVPATRGHQVGMPALLGDLPVGQHDDVVRVPHGTEPV